MDASTTSSEQETVKGGRYTLLRRLGEGSQGETFEARDNGLAAEERPEPLTEAWERYVANARGDSARGKASVRAGNLVAIKRFRLAKAKAWKDVELAEREARTLASLDHPRLPKYIEHFEEDGALYLVMEKVEGESLASIRANKSRLDVTEVTRMLADMAEALRYLHGRAPYIVHRDIKPGNVIRRPDGSFALVDFGAVRDRLKPAGGSTVVGTFGYMAPEQFQGRASPKSDVYGVGATALAMLTGCEPEELPHEGLGIDVARALPKRTPKPLVRALTAMLQPDPDRRAGSIDEALACLEKEAPTLRASSAPLTRKEQRARRRKQKHEERARRRAEEREQRALRRSRSAPLVARFFANLGLLIALIVVWVTVGLVLPLLLGLLSLLFGRGLRRAAAACFGAARRTQDAFGRASSWLAGARQSDTNEPQAAQLRVATEAERVRVADEREHEHEHVRDRRR